VSREVRATQRLAPKVFLLIVALAVIAILARGAFQQQRSTGYREGRAVAVGYDRADYLNPGAADDAQLADDEAAAGAMWAKAHEPGRVSECPTYSAAFRKGCAGYVTDGQR
jgi:hypothetical protein